MKFDLTDDKLYNTLIEIQKRPLMWLHSKSLSELDTFIYAFIWGAGEEPLWYSYFARFVSENCPNSIFCGNIYANIMIYNKCGEQEGFDLFFDLLYKFSAVFEQEQEMSCPEHKEFQPECKAYAIKLRSHVFSHFATDNIRSQVRKLFDEEEELAVFEEWSKDKETVTIVLGNKNNVLTKMRNRRELKSLPIFEIPLTHLEQYMFTEIKLDWRDKES